MMNKTQRQFLRLGDYITKCFNVEAGKDFNISKQFSFHRKEDGYSFEYYSVFINVNEREFWVRLPESIDIADFNKSILLKDMWHDVVNYNPIESIMVRLAPAFADVFQRCGKAFIQISEDLITVSNKDGK